MDGGSGTLLLWGVGCVIAHTTWVVTCLARRAGLYPCDPEPWRFTFFSVRAGAPLQPPLLRLGTLLLCVSGLR